MQAEVDGHKQLLKIHEDYLKSAKNLAATNTAKLAQGMIKEHLQLLADIQNQSGLTEGSGARRTEGSAARRR